MIRSVITGSGSALPAQRVSNHQLAEKVDTSDDWIVQRTGIKARHIANASETTASLGLTAARRALEAAGIAPSSIDLVLLATSTPDQTFPATAVTIQAELGITNGMAMDMQAVCSGFVYALTTADAYLKTGLATKALVIGSETFSRLLDWEDRTTCVLFGDGAGAVVLEAREHPSSPQIAMAAGQENGPARGPGTVKEAGDMPTGILSCRLRADGRHRDKLYVDGGPSTTQTVGHLKMEGREVFRYAIGMISDVIEAVFDETGLDGQTLDWFVPHQANKRIIDGSAKKLGIAPEKVIMTVQDHGNTSAASIPLAFDQAMRSGRIKSGHTVLFEAMGGGFTWGAVLVRL